MNSLSPLAGSYTLVLTVVDGAGGYDTLDDGAGADVLRSGDGADTINANDAAAGDTVDCGLGVDSATVNKGDTTVGCEKVTTR